MVRALLWFSCAWIARADVTPAPLFCDHAVLQRDKPAAIWGQADAGEKISVAFADQARTTTAGADGRWIVYLDALATNATGADLTIAGRNTVTIHDVVVGEVWLCSGQSNMEFPVDRAANAPAEIAAASFPLLRHIKVQHQVAERPVDAAKTTGWQPTAPDNIGRVTAVGYFFAREVQAKLGVPVGLIDSSWGGTPIESWLSLAAVASDPKFQVIGERWQQTLAAYPAAMAGYPALLAEWTKADAAAKAGPKTPYPAWQRTHPRPRAPRGVGDSWTPTGLFNGMINPLLPYALRGVLWYQGESNAERAGEYHAYFAALIAAWRAHFGQGEVPFFWVSLANYDVPNDATHRRYAFLREAQAQALSLPATGEALAIDVGDPLDIHPTNKQEVGRRLALLAKNRVYGFTGDDTGPTFVEAHREGAALRVRFDHASGLVAHDRPVQSLELAGADRVFHPATGRIDRETLIVSAAAVKEPVAVRYAFTNAPEANLYNGAGLPAVPFRSDGW